MSLPTLEQLSLEISIADLLRILDDLSIYTAILRLLILERSLNLNDREVSYLEIKESLLKLLLVQLEVILVQVLPILVDKVMVDLKLDIPSQVEISMEHLLHHVFQGQGSKVSHIYAVEMT